MKAIGAFLLGLFTGWLVKTMVADADLRHRIRAYVDENSFLQDRIRSLEVQTKPKSLETKSLTAPATQPVEQPRPVKTNTRKDDLKVINGIGPALEKRLNDTGIYTFADLVQLTPEELEARLGNPRRVATADLIEQAKEFARQGQE
jgi:predicted flap endonuclease-1-like 5' DNA nuclease